MHWMTASLSGILFGFGLILSGMTSPAKVKGFLDIFGKWNPSLALVMSGAIAVGFFVFRFAAKKTTAWNGEKMDLPTSNVIDKRLVIGGVLFGAGWGIAGYCPGPVLVAASAGSLAALGFVGAMIVGMVGHDWLATRR